MSDVSPAPCRFVAAIPILASLDITRSVDFFRQHLGFQVLYAVHRADGARLAVMGDKDQAVAVAIAHELAPVSVH